MGWRGGYMSFSHHLWRQIALSGLSPLLLIALVQRMSRFWEFSSYPGDVLKFDCSGRSAEKKKKSHESADSINIIQPKHVSAKSHNNQFCQILQQWFGTKPHLSTLFWASRRTQEMDFSKAWYLKVELPEPLINNVRRHGEKGLQFIIILSLYKCCKIILVQHHILTCLVLIVNSL